MDGAAGSGSASKQQTLTNLQQITAYLESLRSDFLFIQEIDYKAKRSFFVDELSHMVSRFPKYGAGFAINYKAAFVPVTLSHPMGSVSVRVSVIFNRPGPPTSF
jgi:hypothetical protein